MAGTIEAKFDVVGAIIAFEEGALDQDGTLELFQHLVDNGMAWTLQGAYGRTAAQLLEAGLIHRAGESADAAEVESTSDALGEDYDTVKHFAQSNPTDDAVSLAELVSAKLGIELTTAQAADIYAATI